MMRKTKVCIVTSVHPALDTRIFHKQAHSLARAGYDVVLIAPGDGDKQVGGIDIKYLKKPGSRLLRWFGFWRPLKLALKQRADIYHIHDPELLLMIPFLKALTGSKIIFDIHENVKHQIRNKEWIPKRIRLIVAKLYGFAERVFLRFCDTLVIAEDSYAQNYEAYSDVICIHNYPIITSQPDELQERRSYRRLIYVGGLSEARGILSILEAAKLVKRDIENLELFIVGKSGSKEFDLNVRRKIDESDLDAEVTLTGWLPFVEAQKRVTESDIGLVLLKPIKNYIESFPTKLFEYMVAGLPVVASDFPIIKDIVEEHHCGLTVDPNDPDAIARAITWICEHPNDARMMGENGRRAVVEIFNWTQEESLLLSIYDRLLGNQADLPAGEKSAM